MIHSAVEESKSGRFNYIKQEGCASGSSFPLHKNEATK